MRWRAGGDVGGPGPGEGQTGPEAGLVHGVEHACGVLPDRAVAAGRGDQALQLLGGVDAPDHLPQGGAVLHRGRERCARRGVEVEGLAGAGLEHGVFVGPFQEEEPEVVEEPDAFAEVVDAVGDRFDSLDSHGFLVSRVAW